MNRFTLLVSLLIIFSQCSILIANEIDHAKKQVEHMLADRPGMVVFRESGSQKAAYIDKNSVIYQLAVEVFAGKYTGERVFWDNHEPPKGTLAIHGGIATHGINTISVGNQTGDNADAFESMWSSFFYEALNMSQVDGWKSVTNKAKNKLVTPDEYVKECAKLEWSAYQLLRKFQADVWSNWAKNRFHSKPDVWFPYIRYDADFEAWYASWKDKAEYPWNPFLKQYEFFSASGTKAK